MNAEIICVGTELLLGDILNTNAQYLSRRLAELGFNVYSQSVVGDNKERLSAQIKQSFSRSEILILSGGLGPTADDITKEVLASVLERPLEMHKASYESIKDYFARTGRVMSESNKKQAMTIKGALVLENKNGTAPGYINETKRNIAVLLPGPPNELIPMFEESVVPYLAALSNSTILSQNIRIFGIGESVVAEQCGELLNSKNPTVATYAKTGEVDIRITGKARNEEKARKLIYPVSEQIVKHFGTNVYGIDCDNLQQRVVELLSKQGKKIATAESCTAGMLSGRITQVSGSSDVFEMGVTAYANFVKVQTLGVSADDIVLHGAVSKEVAAQMAVGVKNISGADIGVGITGVAGPNKSEGKPAGLVYIAVSDGVKVFVRKIMCRGSNRENTRITATSTALDMVRRYLENAEDLISFGTEIGQPINLMEGYELQNNEPMKKSTEIPSQFKELQSKLDFGDGEMQRLVELINQKEILLPANGADSKEKSFTFGDDEEFEDIEEIPKKLQISKADKPKAESDALNLKLQNPEKENEEIKEEPKEEKKEPAKEEIKEEKNELVKAKVKREKSNIKPSAEEKNRSKKKKSNFVKTVFPTKGDKPLEILRKILFLVSLTVLIISVTYLSIYFAVGAKQNKEAQNLSAAWHKKQETTGDEKGEDGTFLFFEDLKKANSDIKGWLKIDGTKIDYPVYQTTDNDFYINHDKDKNRSKYGAIFIDSNSQIGTEKNGRNTVIYGHSMRDGAMFGELKNYRNFDFYSQHSTFEFTSLYTKGEYKVFAVFVTNTLAEHDNGEVFNYRKSAFSNEEMFNDWINEIKIRSLVNTNIDVNFEDQLITLSTCAYDFDDARLVVMARKVRGEEDKAANISASVNPSPLYPEIWYTEKGQAKPQISSDISSSSSDNSSSLDSDSVGSNLSSGDKSEASSVPYGQNSANDTSSVYENQGTESLPSGDENVGVFQDENEEMSTHGADFGF